MPIYNYKYNLEFKLKPTNIYEYIYICSSISLVFLNWIPDLSKISSFIFISMFVLCFLTWLYTKSKTKQINIMEITILTLISYIVINLFVAITNNIDLMEWFRSAISIIVLINTLFIIVLFKKTNLNFIFSWFIITALIWLIVLIFLNNINVVYVMINFYRITGIDQNFSLPYSFLVALLLIYLYKVSFFNILLIGFFSIFIILTGYKAQIILLMLSLFFYYIKIAQNSNRTFFLIVNICLIIISINVFPFVVEYIKLRMTSLGGAGDEVRIYEILSALNLFEQAPFLGNGLGLQFPLEGGNETKNYIHNIFFYYISTLGFLGVFLFTMVFILVFYSINKNTIFVTPLHIVFVMFLLTALTAASFKLVHFNYFLTILIGTLYGIINYKRTDID